MFHQLPANWVCLLFGAKQMVCRVLLELFRRKRRNGNNGPTCHRARQLNNELNVIVKFRENRGELWVQLIISVGSVPQVTLFISSVRGRFAS